MSEVTEADREKAAELADQIDSMGPAMTYRTLASALADERAKARAPFLALIKGEADEAQKHPHYAMTIEVPMVAGTETIDRIFEAVADAAGAAQPEDRDWDVSVHGCGPSHGSVPLHMLRRAAEDPS